MKKYTLILVVSAFIFGSFILNVNFTSAYDSGCNGTDPYSATTGQLCGTSTVTVVVECSVGDLFSSATGQPCNTWRASSSTSLNQQFQIGARGESVRAFQQVLKDTGFLIYGKVDGIYGPITAEAAARYYQRYPYPIFPPICPLTVDINGFASHVCPPPPTFQSPIINGISGPQTLNVNEQGTWSVMAYDRNGGNLFYSVDWGDQPYTLAVSAEPSMAATVRQSAVFTHSYLQAGMYTPTFFVTNAGGAMTQASLSVNVGGTKQQVPAIYSLSQYSGPVGTKVVIYGNGFATGPQATTNNNSRTTSSGENFINLGSSRIPGSIMSIDGTSLTFIVPSTKSGEFPVNNCNRNDNDCNPYAISMTPGTYPVVVENANGASNAVNFTVVSQ